MSTTNQHCCCTCAELLENVVPGDDVGLLLVSGNTPSGTLHPFDMDANTITLDEGGATTTYCCADIILVQPLGDIPE